MRLCLNLGKTLQQLRSQIDSDELPLWVAYESEYGFPLGRIEAVGAIAGSCVARSMGSRVTAKDLIPVYREAKPMKFEEGGAEMMAIWAKSHNSKLRRRN